MEKRKSAFGRPSGTDGSDFSYRMVVDSRYTKVAKAKSRLSTLIFIQAVIQLMGLAYILLSSSKEEGLNRLAISSPVAGLISLMIGELGRRHSRINLLRLCMFGSSVAIVLSIIFLAERSLILKVIQTQSDWKTKFELLETARIFLGSVVQIFLAGTIFSLIGNMTPPKRAR